MSKINFSKIFSLLEKEHKKTMLDLLSKHTIFQQLVATLLSARTKDTTVLDVVGKLFKKYKNPKDFASADLSSLEKEIYRIGFYRNKSKNVKKLGKVLVEEYNGKVRDVYTLDNGLLVMVASDRISAFDHVLAKGIPFKGQVLNQVATMFLNATEDIVPNWLVETPDPSVAVGIACEPISAPEISM